jgi:hypothetical protein
MPHLHIPAHQLRLGDTVHLTPNCAGRRVAGCRIQGARPEVVIIWADNTRPTTCPAGDLLHIHRDTDEQR